MQVKWTAEQEKAVYGEKANCLVSAAAGSGKTQVLTGRILRRVIQEKIDIDRILVVTFTNAAAAEMRSRISKSLTKALAEEPQNEHLQRQLSLLGAATITTMDSFCLGLLRTYFVEAGIDAGFRVADGTEANLLRAECAELALEEMYKNGEKDFLQFADCYSSMKDDSALCDIVISLYSFAESMPDPEGWLAEKAGMYHIENAEDFEKSPFARAVLDGVLQELEGAAARCADAVAEFSGAQSYVEAFEADRLALLSLCKKAESWDDLCEAMDTFSWPRRRREENAALGKEAEEVRKAIKKQAEDAFLRITCTADESAAIMRDAAPHVRALHAFVTTFARVYTAKKQEKNILDYSDLEHMAIRLLSEKTADGYFPSAIASSLRDKYDEIYIDEYQDSNDVQELLFTLISGESIGSPNMFMVGDMKQSIYGFRKTSPALFIQKSETYGETGKNKKIFLSKNFRSRPEVLDFVNHVFQKLMSREIGGIAYTAREMLYPGAAYPEGAEKCISFAIADTDENAAGRMEAEAYLIAREIEKAMQTEVYDPKTGAYRKACYGDIAVIMRSARDMAGPLRAACAAADIPLYCDMGGGYFESVEISVFLSLLRTLDNPQDDIPLLATLRAPFFGFTEEELAQIRLRDRKQLFYFAVKKTAEEDTLLGTKCKAFLKKLKKWRRQAAFLPTDTLILKLLEETGYLLFVSAAPGGETKKANLELLFEKAHRFEQTSFRGLFQFLQYVERISSRGDEVGEAKLVGEGENVVRMMSIHKSKGLEFPIVILAGTKRQFNRKSIQGPFLFHKDLGIGISHVEPDRRIRYETPARAAIALRKNSEELGEELRVLYVALTRAKERLIITAATDAEGFYKSQKGGLSVAEVLHADSFLTLLGRAVKDDDKIPVEIYAPFARNEKEEKARKWAGPEKPTAQVRKILEYRYEKEELRQIPSKISVTEFKRLKEETDQISFPLYKSTELKLPRFRTMEGNIKGASFGTLMHFIMQNIPYREIHTQADVVAYLETLLAKKILSESQAKAVDTEKIFCFWDGEMGRRIRKADRVYREVPFTQTIPASLLTGENRHKDEKIVMQGIIDCFFFEGNEIVLLDYKTDAVKSAETIKKRYKNQMECYAMALRQKYFSEISQKVIYLFSNNGIIVL